MMELIAFEKYEGAGNDFIILDFFHNEAIDLEDNEFMRRLCDRHFGIGADGIMALCPEEGLDFRMKYLNSDGNFSTFCGNGSRCISLYAFHKWGRKNFRFIAADGIHESVIVDNDTVRVKMKDIQTLEKTSNGILVQSGSPHLIFEVEDPLNYPIRDEGRFIRRAFSAEGANVNFVEIINDHQIVMATYERGVEDETLACGTGIVAASYYLNHKLGRPGLRNTQIKVKGGELEVEMELNQALEASNIYLTGPARKTFSGFWNK